MHAEAHAAVGRMVDALALASLPLRVLDIGGRPVNGGIRDLFHPECTWTVLDAIEGEGVDIVADARVWKPDREWDVVISTEVLEHAKHWPAVIYTMAMACRFGGSLMVTCATDPREPHSAIDGWELREGEFYANVGEGALREVMEGVCRGPVTSWTHPRGDLYAYATR